MPAMPGPVTDEKSALLASMRQQRQNLRTIAHGLTDEEARSTPSASALSVGSLIKHVTTMESSWMERVDAAPHPAPSDQLSFEEAAAKYRDDHTMSPNEALSGLVAALDAQEAVTEGILANTDLDESVPVPSSAPWWPAEIDAWSVRWVLLHIIEETARHSGHADIIRETLDGATWFELMAATDGMPETPWLKPWSRAAT
jgi:uncharacterized damage-inducible protein DinB